jgi:excisionase family DNA binding protein
MKIMREYFSIKELAEYAGISVRKLRDMINASLNPIPALRLGGSIKVKRSEFDEWAKSCRRVSDLNDLVDRIVDEFRAEPKKRNSGEQSRSVAKR